MLCVIILNMLYVIILNMLYVIIYFKNVICLNEREMVYSSKKHIITTNA